MFRFLVIPDSTESSERLIELYRVDPKECLIWNQDMGDNISDHLIKLRPRKDGKYYLYRSNYQELTTKE